MFRRALVPIDGSQLALQAIDVLAQVLDPEGDVLLISVIDTPEQWLRSLQSAGIDLSVDVELAELADLNTDRIAQAIEGQRDDARRALEQATKRLEGHGVARVSHAIRAGRPGAEIVRAVEDHSRDLVVITSHGWSGLQRAVLGSVAEYVVRHNRAAPVLIAYPREGNAP